MRSLAFQITRTFACPCTDLASLHNFRNISIWTKCFLCRTNAYLSSSLSSWPWRHAIPAGFVRYARASLNAHSRQVSSSRTERCAQNCYASTVACKRPEFQSRCETPWIPRKAAMTPVASAGRCLRTRCTGDMRPLGQLTTKIRGRCAAMEYVDGTLSAAEAQRKYAVTAATFNLLEGEARGYGVPRSGRGWACSSAGERGRRHTDDDEVATARQGR